MAFIADEVFDSGLDNLDTGGTRLDITLNSAGEPATYANVTTNTLGNDTVNTGAPEPGDIDGRKVVIPAITAGDVTGAGTQTAGFWALTNGTDTLWAAGPLTATQDVTNGNTFTLDAINITIRDATAV